MDGRRVARLGFALVVFAGATVVIAGALGAEAGSATRATDVDEGGRVAPPSDGITVVSTDSNTWLGRGSDGPRAKAELFAVAPGGELLYYDDSHTRYWDVDPVAGTNTTVEYVYADHLNASECGGESVCTRNGVERVNLTTGEVTPVFSRVTPGKHSTRWHDVDRIDDSRLVVADIGNDRVFVVNTTTGIAEWAWNAQSEFEVDESGGPYPGDWTHLNDVEVLEDGRLMVSLRNHDQVVFLDRETGLVEDRTLGSDGNHDVIYEQHNPDHIPAERGGPSVLVADSENDRVVEYHRTDGSWERTWTWRDGRLAWPRDADRLPDGRTLVTDSNGNRVIEVARNGTVVWELEVAFPYEAERLGTGDESTGGPARPGATSGGAEDGSGETANGTATPAVGDSGGNGNDGLFESSSLVSGRFVNAVRYVMPVWMGAPELVGLVLASLAAVLWAAVEWHWSTLTVGLRSPVDLERRR
jgi:hypothetical protein